MALSNSIEASPATPQVDGAVSCDLCGLTAHQPRTSTIEGRDRLFCCGGCEQVFRLLVESGEFAEGADLKQSPIYQQCLAMGLISHPDQQDDGRTIADGPRAALSYRHTIDAPIAADSEIDATRNASFQVTGMWCSSCAWLIEHVVGKHKGVESCRVFFASDVARVTYKPARTSEEDIAAAIRGLGYTVERYSDATGAANSPAARARRAEFIRAVVAMIFAVNVNMFSMALFVGYFQKIGPAATFILPRWMLVLSLPVVWAGIPIFRRAWEGMRQGVATMETLVTLGALTSFFYSIWSMLHGDIKGVYFDTADMLIALILIGKHTEAGARGDASSAIALLYGLLPRKAVVRAPDGRDMLIALDKLAPGDCVVVRPGERIPADGRVVEGTALIDESLLSGESMPVRKTVGDEVTGATLSTDAPLMIEVTRTGEESTLSKMIALVEDAITVKSPTERWADRISRFFVPSIIAIALVTGLCLWLAHAAPSAILVRVVSILVIACPCALALATPLAITTGVGAAAMRGILIANTAVLETLPRVRRVMIDKTGTLTEGLFAVREFTGTVGDLAVISALESRSEHPLAYAIVAHAAPQLKGEPPVDVRDFQRVEGMGVTAVVGAEGSTWFIGNRALAQSMGSSTTADLDARALYAERDGMTVLFYGTKSTPHPDPGKGEQEELVRGMLILGDAPRTGAESAVKRLKGLGIEVELISGDAAATTQALAARVEIDRATGEMTPEDKIVRVRAVQQEMKPGDVVAMVGDGINDAPALAQAGIGISFGSGTEIARRASDITLVSEDLGRLADLFALSNRTAQIIRQNLFWACIYNSICIPLAVAGFVNPIVAAAAMLVSSMSVVFNTKRLKWEFGVK